MKTVVVPVIEEMTPFNCFSPYYYFDTDWCLDLHGFLNRDEFKNRLKEINNHVRTLPLMTARAKRLLLSLFGGGATLLVGFILFNSLYRSKVNNYTVYLIVDILLAIGFFVAKYIVDDIAKRRAEEFTTAMNDLFTRYNRRENPTANWTLVWRSVLTHYKVKANFDGGVKGEITPKYAESAEIVLEINDALSDLTASTVRVNLANVSIVNDVSAPTYSQTSYQHRQ